jgi:cyclase
MFSISDSIFVTENSNGAANSGIIVTDKGVVLVDSTFFPSKAKRIEEFVSSITSKTLLYVVNTHYHLDHTLGNCAIEAPVVGSAATKKFLEKFDLESFKKTLEPLIQKELKDAKLIPPSVVFKNRITFEMGDKKIEVVRMGGHTPDSSVVYVWPDSVCFCGDLVFAGYHAEIEEDSDLNKWILNLKKIKEKKPKWIVPGHGKVGGMEEIDDMILYLEKFKKLSKLLKLKHTKEIVDNFGEDPIFAKRGFALLFEESLVNYLKGRKKDGKNFSSHKA